MTTRAANPVADSASTPDRRFRGTAAILAGLAANVVLGLGTDQALHATGVYPPWGQPMADSLFGLATAYRVAFGVLGCWLAARLAPDRPMWHAMAVGVIGVVVSTVGLVMTWNAGPAFGPKWYPIALVLVTLPCAWLGGKLRERQLRQQPGAR